MEFLKLYEEENRDILYSMSWLNKNSIFDKSIGSFKEIDLFTFLENINEFDYSSDIFYDDIYYVLEYTQDSLLYLINNINKEIKREHKIIPISQAKEFDKKTILWLSRQDGRTIKEKLKNNKIKAVKRYKNVDTYENRIFKIFIKKLVVIFEVRQHIQNNDYILNKIRQWLRSEDAKSINEYGNIVYNNILLHHPHYSKIFKGYKWLNRLDEKVAKYQDLYPKQIINILTFSILSKLQFKTKKLVLADNVAINFNEFEIFFSEKCLPENLNLLDNITSLKVKTIDEIKFNNIKNLEKNILKKQLNIKLDRDRTFKIDENGENKLFIDLFRLFPIVRLDDQVINFPITLKQKIDNKIVNANNTKIIDLSNEIFTLPEILKTYDTNILKYFLEDLEKQFRNKQLNYIIPDYVNVFEFSQVKKSINSYFKNNRNIPKSILAGLQHLFSGKLLENDTLIYIQKDHNNDLHVTPLLVKFDKNLTSITKGLYLEKHPTKKLLEDNDILDELNNAFGDELSEKLLSKFLQNGIKGIKQQHVAFYLDDEIVYLDNSIKSTTQDRKLEVRKLFHNGKLFQSNTIEIEDSNKENLYNFEKLLDYEKKGILLWKEHLPDLSIEIVRNGYYDKFILVDDQSEIIANRITIQEHFIIPKGIQDLSFTLILDNANIGYKAVLLSNELPFEIDIECELYLTYDYERENPYLLVFKPLNNQKKNIHVRWTKDKISLDSLPVPDYPVQRSWFDFTQDPKRNGNGYSDLLEWIDERLALLEIDKIPDYIIEKKQKEYSHQQTGTFEWGAYDKNNNYYCRVLVEGESIFCHSSKFIEEIDKSLLHEGKLVYLDILKNDNGHAGNNISFSKMNEEEIKKSIINKWKIQNQRESVYDKTNKLVKAIRSLRYPLLTVWNAHSLHDVDVPAWFKRNMEHHIDMSLKMIANKEASLKLKEELLFVLSCMHQDMPRQIYNMLQKFSEDNTSLKKYGLNFGLALGNMTMPWQIKIFENIIKYLDFPDMRHEVFEVLAIATWRSKVFIYHIESDIINKIVKYLLIDLKNSTNLLKENSSVWHVKHVAQNLELLLSLLRYRIKVPLLLSLNEIQTQTYIQELDKINRHVIDNKINIKTRIDLQIDKPSAFLKMPDLIYALRVYLSGDNGAANTIKIIGVSDD